MLEVNEPSPPSISESRSAGMMPVVSAKTTYPDTVAVIFGLFAPSMTR